MNCWELIARNSTKYSRNNLEIDTYTLFLQCRVTWSTWFKLPVPHHFCGCGESARSGGGAEELGADRRWTRRFQRAFVGCLWANRSIPIERPLQDAAGHAPLPLRSLLRVWGRPPPAASWRHRPRPPISQWHWRSAVLIAFHWS